MLLGDFDLVLSYTGGMAVQELRDRLPSFKGQPDKYIVWGEGTTDEMCLAILLVTRP